MTNAYGNMAMPVSGSILLIYLITYPSQLLLRVRFELGIFSLVLNDGNFSIFIS